MSDLIFEKTCKISENVARVLFCREDILTLVAALGHNPGENEAAVIRKQIAEALDSIQINAVEIDELSQDIYFGAW